MKTFSPCERQQSRSGQFEKSTRAVGLSTRRRLRSGDQGWRRWVCLHPWAGRQSARRPVRMPVGCVPIRPLTWASSDRARSSYVSCARCHLFLRRGRGPTARVKPELLHSSSAPQVPGSGAPPMTCALSLRGRDLNSRHLGHEPKGASHGYLDARPTGGKLKRRTRFPMTHRNRAIEIQGRCRLGYPTLRHRCGTTAGHMS